MPAYNYLLSGNRVTRRDEQDEDSNDTIGSSVSTPSTSRNLENIKDEDIPEDCYPLRLIEGFSDLDKVPKSPAPVPTFNPVIPTGPPERRVKRESPSNMKRDEQDEDSNDSIGSSVSTPSTSRNLENSEDETDYRYRRDEQDEDSNDSIGSSVSTPSTSRNLENSEDETDHRYRSDEQDEDSNDSIGSSVSTPSTSRNLENSEDETDYRDRRDEQDEDSNDSIGSSVSTPSTSRNLENSEDETDYRDRRRDTKQQSIRVSCKFEANVIISKKRATLCLWRSQKWLFVDRNTPFSVRLRKGRAGIDWFVRCTVVFTASEYKDYAVKRCENETHNRLPVEGALGIIEVVEHEAWYYGSGTPNSHYSVVVPLKAHTTTTTVRYQMTCTTKCMGRRELALDFTLEDNSGVVYGRDRIRVCPCAQARRDLKKAKENLAKQTMERARSAQPEEQPGPSKKCDLKTAKKRLAQQTMEQARSAQPQEQPGPSKKLRVQTPPVEIVLEIDENSTFAGLTDDEKCVHIMKLAAGYKNISEYLSETIKTMLKNHEQKRN